MKKMNRGTIAGLVAIFLLAAVFLYTQIVDINDSKINHKYQQQKEALEKAKTDSIIANESPLDRMLPAEKSKTIDSIFRPLSKTNDDMRDMAFYKDSRLGYYDTDNDCYAYISRNCKNNQIKLHLRINYHAADWLFFTNCTVKCDTLILTIDVKDKKTDVLGGGAGIREWFDNADDGAVLKTISNSKTVKLRLSSDKYYNDRQLSPTEISAIKNVVTKYIAAGGQL